MQNRRDSTISQEIVLFSVYPAQLKVSVKSTIRLGRSTTYVMEENSDYIAGSLDLSF